MYGWPDEQVLDLRISRLVQIVDVIGKDLHTEMLIRRDEISWQTQALASFVANTVEDKKGRAQLLQMVEKLDLNAGLRNEPGSSADTSAADGPIDMDAVTARALEHNGRLGSISSALRLG